MECNKDEAVRARELAESRMQCSDFVGARKLGLKAQKLFPELENIAQLLAVCDVHCSSQIRVNGCETDWYGILQVEKVADEATIKKQYRKLALLLHPDKNKFAGAEAAFKLIGEANRVLTDHGKRSLYDMKIRVPVRTAAPKGPPHQVNRKPYARPQYVTPDANLQFMGSNVQQHAFGRETFWTACPFCNVRYQYYKEVMNRSLKCQSCTKPFIAYDVGAQGVSQGPNRSQPAYTHQKELPTVGTSKATSHNSSWKPQSGTRAPEISRKTAPELKTEATGRGSRNKGRTDECVNLEKDGMPKTDTAKPGLCKAPRNIGRKRGRNMVVESSESCGTSDSDESDDVSIHQNGGKRNSGFNGDHNRRTSARNKRNISYAENLSDDDDFVNTAKVSNVGESSSAWEEEVKEDGVHVAPLKTNSSSGFSAGVYEAKDGFKDIESGPVTQSLPSRTGEATEFKVSKEEVEALNGAAKVNGKLEPEPELYQCPDPEFSDFDKGKVDNNFAVDQIWAVYDTADGMPRFYARIAKVIGDGFKLQITWLEPHPDGQDQVNWVKQELPVACGNYKLGSDQYTTDRPMFSHQVDCWKGNRRRSYVIYPRQGEIWALFRDWDIRWSFKPDEHRCFKYEIVEVLANFVDGVGFQVVYLDKIKGFVSLFRQTPREGIVSFTVPPKELYRFSHQIPSFKMSGTERVGVPKGCYELDTAALPADLFGRLDCAIDSGMGSEGMDAEVNASCSGMPENDVKPTHSPKKSVDMQEKNDLVGNGLKLRRSPRQWL